MAKRNFSFTHRITYINWNKESTTQTVKIDIGDEKYQWLKKNGVEAKSMTKREDWLEENTYKFVRNGYWRSLTFFSDNSYNRWVWHSGDDSRNTGIYTNPGTHAAKAVNEKFQERTGKTLRGAFGYTEDDTLRACVPKQFYYIKDRLCNTVLSNVSKADMSSHYPANITGSLPDIRTAIRVEGEVDPSAEYPFAFYIGSGHCAEYKRFDTREWANHEIAYSLLNEANERSIQGRKFKYYVPRYKEKTQYTLLCKPSKYTLTDEMQFFYNKKNLDNDPTAKMVMNAFIGFCHPKADRQSYRLYHLAAICIGRANQLMIETAEKIGVENVLQLVVDGIIYIDEDAQITTYSKAEKQLGRLILENYKEQFKMIGTNQYMFIDSTGEVTCIKAGGFNAGVDGTKTFEDMVNWRKV